MINRDMLRSHKGKICRIKNPICDCFGQSKCLSQIKKQKLLLTYAPISELPSNISTMAPSETLVESKCIISLKGEKKEMLTQLRFNSKVDWESKT